MSRLPNLSLEAGVTTTSDAGKRSTRSSARERSAVAAVCVGAFSVPKSASTALRRSKTASSLKGSMSAGMEIGYDSELDRQRGFNISPGGVVVIARGERIDADPVSPKVRTSQAG